MQQQPQQELPQGSPADDTQDPGPQHAGAGNDDSWGLGSASALDTLRRQNFRGHRSAMEENPPPAD
ncbi:MAG: hypothetical protein NVS2B4_15050 [Ramlibacter sp.]